MVEIEAPTEAQKTAATYEEFVSFARQGLSRDDILFKMMARGVPKSEAEEMLSEILQHAQKGRRETTVRKKLPGAIVVSISLGLFIDGRSYVWAILVLIFGVLLFLGKLKFLGDGIQPSSLNRFR